MIFPENNRLLIKEWVNEQIKKNEIIRTNLETQLKYLSDNANRMKEIFIKNVELEARVSELENVLYACRDGRSLFSKTKHDSSVVVEDDLSSVSSAGRIAHGLSSQGQLSFSEQRLQAVQSLPDTAEVAALGQRLQAVQSLPDTAEVAALGQRLQAMQSLPDTAEVAALGQHIQNISSSDKVTVVTLSANVKILLKSVNTVSANMTMLSSQVLSQAKRLEVVEIELTRLKR